MCTIYIPPSRFRHFSLLRSFPRNTILRPLRRLYMLQIIDPPSITTSYIHPTMSSSNQSDFHDFLPTMADKLGGERLIEELCNGFAMLMDPSKRVITFDSLKKNSAVLGLEELTDDDLLSMLKEGDFDGDGVLNQMEFCVLMFRLSPDLMKQSRVLLEEAFQLEFKNH